MTQTQEATPAWRFGVLPIAAVLALLVSTQYLAQPFVWRHWPVDEVLLGWLEVLRDRLAVALAMALAIVAALRLPSRGWWRAATVAASIVAGAAVGEGLISLAAWPSASHDGAEFWGRVLRWSVAGGGIAALRVAQLRALAADAAVRGALQLQAESERQLSSLRMQALRSQIEPHFLFNTLATVKRLGNTEPVQCERLLTDLHTFVRLSQAAQPAEGGWTLGQELELVRSYLGVIERRMDGRLSVRITVDAALQTAELPALALATLVENAVKHGITPSTRDGSIAIAARGDGADLVVAVADTGVGFGAGSGGSGIGLANTRSRLATRYASRASLALHANQPSGVVATLRLPWERV
jgi:hypothetical protein